MQKVYVEDIGKHVGTTVQVEGWVYNSRTGGKLFFLMLRDGSGILQAVAFKPEIGDDRFAELTTLTQESSIRVWGPVKADPRAPGGYEMSIAGFEIVQIAAEFPITPKEHGSAFLLDHRHLWLRSKKQFAILRVRARTQNRWISSTPRLVRQDTPISAQRLKARRPCSPPKLCEFTCPERHCKRTTAAAFGRVTRSGHVPRRA